MLCAVKNIVILKASIIKRLNKFIKKIIVGIPIKILIVEDEMLIAANISLQLKKLGYNISGMISRGEEALNHIEKDKPDIVLLDIQLKGKMDGIETAQLIQNKYVIPIIYLTANVDNVHFNRAKATKPYAFIAKPFKKLDLQRAIELTVTRMMTKNAPNITLTNKSPSPAILSDRIFVKDHEKMVKITIKDIYYVEADRNYCRIFSKGKEYLLVMTLKDINEKLPAEHFIRIHRSYIINLSHVNEVAGNHVVISKKAVPLSKTLRADLLKRLQTI
jgi:DNA-binding LytR/AlgR family response regulator